MVHSVDAAEAAEQARPAPVAGGGAFEIVSDFEPAGDQPEAIAQLIAGLREGERDQVLLGVTRVRQDLHHDPRDQGARPAHADPRAQQDPRRPALRRDEGVPAQQLRRVFRLLLRLLSAGGVRPALGHLYREGRLHQRAHRPHAPQRHARAAGARGRGDRGLGLVHLRHRGGRDLFVDGSLARAAGAGGPARADPQADRPAVPPHQPDAGARQLPRARRRDRAVPGAFRGPRLAHLALRRRDRGDHRVRPAHRHQDRQARARAHLSQQPLRHAAPHRAPGDQAGQGRARPPAGGVQCAGSAAGGFSGWSSALSSTWR